MGFLSQIQLQGPKLMHNNWSSSRKLTWCLSNGLHKVHTMSHFIPLKKNNRKKRKKKKCALKLDNIATLNYIYVYIKTHTHTQKQITTFTQDTDNWLNYRKHPLNKQGSLWVACLELTASLHCHLEQDGNAKLETDRAKSITKFHNAAGTKDTLGTYLSI